MAYDPYKDVKELVSKAKDGVTADTVYDLIRRADTFYKSTYGDLSKQIKATKEQVSGEGAYNDGGAAAIRRAYADYARREQGHTAADIAGENGGNLNSYAAAQANRAARDMLTAGEEAVRERAEAVYDRLSAQDELLTRAAADMMSNLSDSVAAGRALAESDNDLRKSALDAPLDYYGILAKAK